jgi:hypothetical protein
MRHAINVRAQYDYCYIMSGSTVVVPWVGAGLFIFCSLAGNILALTRPYKGMYTKPMPADMILGVNLSRSEPPP